MYYLKRFMMFFHGWKKQPSRKEVNRIYNHYRNEVMSNEVINDYLSQDDFNSLVALAIYGGWNLGTWTAIQAAFCLGYEAGKAE